MNEVIQLGAKLECCSFECLDPESKATILAFLCNELLYCRNVVRDIESNMEEMTRLKGEKWLREGKSRALRAVQTRKRVALKRVSLGFSKHGYIDCLFIFLGCAFYCILIHFIIKEIWCK